MRILTLSNSTHSGSGYAILTKNVIVGLKKAGHEVLNLGNQTLGTVIKDDYGVHNLPFRFSPFLVDSIDDYLVSLDPDLVLSFYDVVMPDGVRVVKSIISHGAPWVCHATVNYSPTPIDLVDRLQYADGIVSPSKFGLKTLAESQIKNATYIPHGIDPKLFFKEKPRVFNI